jgi:hypothetical protein
MCMKGRRGAEHAPRWRATCTGAVLRAPHASVRQYDTIRMIRYDTTRYTSGTGQYVQNTLHEKHSTAARRPLPCSALRSRGEQRRHTDPLHPRILNTALAACCCSFRRSSFETAVHARTPALASPRKWVPSAPARELMLAVDGRKCLYVEKHDIEPKTDRIGEHCPTRSCPPARWLPASSSGPSMRTGG